MKTKLSRLLFTLPFVTFLAGCSANFAPRAMEPAQVAGSPAPAVLDRSLFARDGSGSMSEGDLQPLGNSRSRTRLRHVWAQWVEPSSCLRV